MMLKQFIIIASIFILKTLSLNGNDTCTAKSIAGGIDIILGKPQCIHPTCMAKLDNAILAFTNTTSEITLSRYTSP